VTIHVVAGHVVDLDGPDAARGIVYCHDEVEPISGPWHLGMLQYWDSYRRVPGAGRATARDPRSSAQLPEAFESWSRFWAEVEVRNSR
jgi:hypothetical protein